MRTLPLLAAALLGVSLALTAPAQAAPSIGRYVALGDSFASVGDLTALNGPPGCFRAADNYPNQVAAALAPAEFVDNTCGGATTRDMTEAQSAFGDVNPPQFDGLTAETDLVTLTIGANNLDLLRTLVPCLIPSLAETSFTPRIGNPCEQRFTATGVDTFAQRIDDEVRPAVAAVLRGIRDRAPRATIVAVNYLALVPPTSDECGYWHGVAKGDIPYLFRALRRLSTMLMDEAAHAGDIGVDANVIAGHDMCQTHDKRWVESIYLPQPATPWHPNSLGMRAVGALVVAALRN
ncbi:SGNH/GDSL hydrolase family protein [Nocardia sp. NPDC058058]|uniref:SGNH/GDSL hydrolase family protein n=1 Tax=Nocardia sp. NPDC058058 TaxID=3346317 RepID=UPI0036DDA99C